MTLTKFVLGDFEQIIGHNTSAEKSITVVINFLKCSTRTTTNNKRKRANYFLYRKINLNLKKSLGEGARLLSHLLAPNWRVNSNE